MDDETRRHIRQCYGCDCDGESHRLRQRPLGAARQAVDAICDGIERLTGYRPPTCPWRAMYDPLVGPVMDAVRLGDAGLGAWAVDEDPPAILVDAIGVYLRARNATRAHDDAEEHKRRLAEMRAKQRG